MFHSNQQERSSVDLSAIRDDLNNLQETIAKLISKTKDDSAKSVREMTSEMTRNVTDRVGTMAGDLAEKSLNPASAVTGQAKSLATKATNQVKSFGAELEGIADRNRFCALAGAVVVGILIGMFGRRSQ